MVPITDIFQQHGLPDLIKIDANYKNGELILTLPKKEESTKASHQKISVH